MNTDTKLSLADADGPSWRWKLAERIMRGESATEDTDEHVVQAVALQRALDGHRPATVDPKVDTSSRLIEAAYDIHRENGILRWHVEACAVTGLSDEEISQRCGVSREIVATYIAVFFDVRPQLPPGNWITHYVYGSAPFRGCREDDVRPFWAWMGASGGPKFLRTLVETYRAALRPGDRPVLSVYFRPGVPLPVQVVAAFTVLGMSPDAATTVERYRRRVDRASCLNPKKRRQETKRASTELIRIAQAKLMRITSFQEDAAQPRAPYQRTEECSCRHCHHHWS